MVKPILVFDSDSTLIASWRPFPSAYIKAVKPDGTTFSAGVKLKYPINVNITLLKVIKAAKEAGYTIVLFTNNNNINTYNKKGELLGPFLEVAYKAIKEKYNKMNVAKPIKGLLNDGELFDYVITGVDKERMGDPSTKNLAVLRRVIPGGDSKDFAKRIYFFDDQIPNHDIAIELPHGHYIRVPAFDQHEDGLSSFKHSIREVVRIFNEMNPSLGLGSSRSSRRGSSSSRRTNKRRSLKNI